jgi:uncharacterized membrane protein
MIDTYVIILTAIFGILISSIMFIIKSASKKTKSDAFFVNRFILIGFIFIASHYMAINNVDEAASFYPPYIEKK